jgi:hypothetical protein
MQTGDESESETEGRKCEAIDDGRSLLLPISIKRRLTPFKPKHDIFSKSLKKLYTTT